MRPAAPTRLTRRSAKGQAMAIFALVSVLLFVVAGLAVDAGTSYLTSNQLERAAAAAALAGVAYLPGDQPDAINAALVEAARDGFTNTGTGGTSCSGQSYPSPCVLASFPQTNEMKVQISVSVSTIFLRLVGFGNHTVVRSETAEYLPPISLGQPGAQQGSAMNGSCIGLTSYCSNPPSGLGSSGNFYFEREEGWGNPRSEGDPFTPSPAQNGTGCGRGRRGRMQRGLCARCPRDQPGSGDREGVDREYELAGGNQLSHRDPGRRSLPTCRSITLRSLQTHATEA